MSRLWKFACALTVVALPATAVAQDPTDATSTPPAAETPAAETPAPVAATPDGEAWAEDSFAPSVQIHGFASQGFMISTANKWITETNEGSFELFEAAFNVTTELTSKLRAGIQLFAQDLGPIGNFVPSIDWAYVDYRVRPELGLRFGRFRIAQGIFNENIDVDIARTPILLPQSMYQADFRDVTSSMSGGMIHGTLDLGGAGELQYAGQLGTVDIPPRATYSAHVDRIGGGRLIWSTPVEGLRVHAFALHARFDLAIVVPIEVDYQYKLTSYGGGIDFATDSLQITIEGSMWQQDVTPEMEGLPSREDDDIRAYAMVQYRINDSWAVSLYGEYFDTAAETDETSPETVRKSGALSVRYDITPNWIAKAEGHFIDGTVGVASTTPPEDLEEQWGLFLLKTTVAF